MSAASPPRAAVGGASRGAWRTPLLLGAAAVSAQTLVGLLGGSAAVPPLGPRADGVRGLTPPWDVAAGPGAWTVTAVLVVAAACGAGAVFTGWRAWRRGARVDVRVVAALAGALLVAMVAVPAQGSADHLSYAAYGRIAAEGEDPYVADPLGWRGGTDPVTSAVQPPWQHTPSVYGPVATAAQALAGWWGGGNLRATVGAWQLLCGLAFALASLALHRWAARAGTDLTPPADPDGVTLDPHARVAVLWTLNPLLLGQLVLGAHLDVLAVAAAVVGLTALVRRPVVAGVALGAAVGIKAPYGLALVGAAFGLTQLGRSAWRPGAWTAAGALAVLVPAHLWTGPHTYDQLRTASRFISLAAPWRIVADVTDPLLGVATVRSVVPRLAALAAVVLAVVLWRRIDVRRAPAAATAPDGAAVLAATVALRTFLLLALAWVLTAPYVLPWYDAMVWAPLAVISWGPVLDLALGARLTVLVLAYVPGLNVGVPPALTSVTLAFRHWIAPWLTLAVVVAVAARVGRGPADRGRRSVPDAA